MSFGQLICFKASIRIKASLQKGVKSSTFHEETGTTSYFMFLVCAQLPRKDV